MRRSYKLENLECASCAARMESDINKLEGVRGCSISFMTSKLMLDVEDGSLDSVLAKAQGICRKYERDCAIMA